MSKVFIAPTCKAIFLMIVLGFLPSLLSAQNNLWEPIKESRIPEVGTRYIVPTQYLTFKLDLDQMRAALDKAPMTQTAAVKEKPAFLDIPWPDGSIKTFQIIESPIMEQGLMDKFPEIKTYAGSEVGDESKYIRLDLTPQGFHAMVLTAGEGTVYIDPYSFGGGDIEHYICYFKKDFVPIAGKTMVCDVVGNPVDIGTFNPQVSSPSFGTCEKRTYRLALAATAEYTAFQGGTVALAQAAQVTTMNRVNGLYLRDMAIQMNIIANNNLLIYTNATTDPFTNGNAGTMIGQNQTNTTTVIGSANYDIGHVFGTNSGGLAGLGVVCSSTQKARGVTGSNAPVGDPFDIDYVAHEMGHQFSANHTFNNSCGGNRNNATAMEPGSGSTIMAYAGICAPDVQSNSDDHFHGISLQEIGAFITGAGHTCPVKTVLPNSAPVISGTNGVGITLPISTPFALTATATDPDGNVLTYCWEQMNNQVSTQAPVATSTTGPNFRSNSPTTNPTRYFPSLASQAAGGPFTWEVIPSVTRTMNFRVSVRDNAVAGGCTDHEDVVVSFSASAGPFVVTYPTATGISWIGTTTQTVTWTVANTDIAPVACALVNIYLSTDGGLTYPTLLASNVANDGSQLITVPNTATTTARIMVMCANGTFFDISNNNFTITAATNDYTLAATPTPLTVCQPANGVYTVNIGQVGTYTSPVTLSVTGVPAGATATFGTNPVATPGTSTLTISNTGLAAPGSYNLTLTGNSVSGIKNIPLVLNISGVPTAVTLTTPTNGATSVGVPTTFVWAANVPGSVYAIDIATDAGFVSIVDNATNLATTTYNSTVLAASTTYYWRVRASNTCGTGSFSSTFSFTTANCATYTSTDVPKAISATGTPTVTSVLNIPTVGTITDVNVINLAGTHSYINDLRFSLTSPAATNRILMTQVCADQDNFNINFDDAGALYTAIPCPPTGGGTFQPQNTLAAFNGQAMNGTWTMTVNDLANQDGGSLTSWALRVCYSNPCGVTATPTNITCSGLTNGSAIATATGTAGYTYLWSNGRTTASNTGLAAGTYTLTMTDATSCTATTSVTITQPTAVTASISSSTSVTCRGASTGSATANGTGGTAGYTYLWSNGRTTAANTGLVAGTYIVTVSDANLCRATASVTITQPASAVTASISSSTSVTCNGGSTGSATANGTGGTGTKTYLWSNGRTTAANTGLIAGTYTVTVSDANLCTATASVTISQPSAVTASISSSTNIACNGASTGSATANGTGGTGTKTYVWSNGRTTAANTGLAAGTYIVTVSDANLCTATASVTITQPASALTASISSSTSVTCRGASTGAATVAGAGGTTPYNFIWNNGRTTAANTALVAGTYTVTVSDANLCTATASVTITQPASAVTASISSSTSVTCNGASTGSATANGTGGTGTKTYLWSNGRTTAANTGLAAGTYTVTVSDANLCTATASVTITQPSAVTATISSSTNVTCNGGATGAATANGTGGTGTKTYLWSNGRTTAANTGLIAGTYTVTVSDANLCTAIASVTITQPTAVAASMSSVSETCAGNDGTATVTASGGTAGYSILWNAAAGNQTTATATGLNSGTYSVTVTDVNGCSTSNSVTVNDGCICIMTASITTNNQVSCFGGNNGQATATNVGGIGTVNYSWSNGQNNATATGLLAGAYTVIATDANGCTATASVTITEPAAAVNVSASVTSNYNGVDISCNGSNDGQATAAGSGGTGVITYLWSDGQSNAIAVGFGAGIYTVTATDANSCQAIASITLTDPSAVSLTLLSQTNVLCFGAATGDATVGATGGVGVYNYQWDAAAGSQIGATATGLASGVYCATATDANGCLAVVCVTLTEPSAINLSATTTNGVSCNGAADGSIFVLANGGTGALTYNWSDGQTTATATGLAGGAYILTVTDANGCQAAMPVIISEPTALIGSATDNTDGSITAAATGGTPNYSYQWDAATGNQTTATATGLIHNNTYTVTITDANGCTTTATVTVTIVGLDDIPNLSEFNILPNPSNGEFVIQVSFAQAQDATVKLTNVLGQELRTYNYSTASFNIPIDIQHQASGVYFVTLQTNNKAITRKVVVAK